MKNKNTQERIFFLGYYNVLEIQIDIFSNFRIIYDPFIYIFKNFKNEKDQTKWLEERWNEIRKYYQILNEWYHDYKMYHYMFLEHFQHDKKCLLMRNIPQKHNFQ